MAKKLKKKKETRGRKEKYGEPTEQMIHRVPKSKKKALSDMVKGKLKEYEI